MAPILEEYVPQNIFRVDETALFYSAQPDRMLVLKKVTCHT